MVSPALSSWRSRSGEAVGDDVWESVHLVEDRLRNRVTIGGDQPGDVAAAGDADDVVEERAARCLSAREVSDPFLDTGSCLEAKHQPGTGAFAASECVGEEAAVFAHPFLWDVLGVGHVADERRRGWSCWWRCGHAGNCKLWSHV